MKIMTWNIWGGKRLPEVIEQISLINPDIIGLQEVKEIDGENLAERIAKELGYSYHYCRSITTDRHTPSYSLGNAILSKIPISSEKCHFLSTMDQYERNAATEPRTACEVSIEYEEEPLTIITTHLGFSDGFGESDLREHQVTNLLPLITDRRCILMGDFNSTPMSKTVTRIGEILTNADTQLSEISYIDQKLEDHPQYRIDYIFGEKSLSLHNFQILDTKASDHRPLIVEL